MGRSESLFEASRRVIPGGVNSPVRAFRDVGIDPRFIAGGRGARITDVDGKEYVDYVCSYGPLILGHRNQAVTDSLKTVLEHGTSFGAPTELELALAEKVCAMVPSVEMVRMVNSGTEATLSVVRLARAVTKRDGIIKFAGCYHGHADSFLIRAGSGALTLGVPDSPGVPRSIAEHTHIADYNDLESVESLFKQFPQNIGALIVEPIAGNMGVIPPAAGFLAGLRALCDRHGALLIFDEVMTGFRVAPGGAQELYGVRPDLTAMGKVIGGGLPVGAYGGRSELMGHVAPAGDMYQAGTLSGNPLAMQAGLTQLSMLEQTNAWKHLEETSATLEAGIREATARVGVDLTLNRVGSMMTLFFTEQPVTDFESAASGDRERFNEFFRVMIDSGVYLAPSPFEAMFVSTAHSDDDLNLSVDAFEQALTKAYA